MSGSSPGLGRYGASQLLPKESYYSNQKLYNPFPDVFSRVKEKTQQDGPIASKVCTGTLDLSGQARHQSQDNIYSYVDNDYPFQPVHPVLLLLSKCLKMDEPLANIVSYCSTDCRGGCAPIDHIRRGHSALRSPRLELLTKYPWVTRGLTPDVDHRGIGDIKWNSCDNTDHQSAQRLVGRTIVTREITGTHTQLLSCLPRFVRSVMNQDPKK
jgi:hypothetical protein